MRTRYCHQHRRMTCPVCLAAQPGAVGAWYRFCRFIVALWWTVLGAAVLLGVLVLVVRAVVP